MAYTALPCYCPFAGRSYHSNGSPLLSLYSGGHSVEHNDVVSWLAAILAPVSTALPNAPLSADPIHSSGLTQGCHVSWGQV